MFRKRSGRAASAASCVTSRLLVVLVTIVTMGTMLPKPVYRAEAKLEIGKETERVAQGRQILEQESANVFNPFFLQTQVDILHSRDLARRVIQKLDLPENEEFKAKNAISGNENEREVQLVNALLQAEYPAETEKMLNEIKEQVDDRLITVMSQLADQLAQNDRTDTAARLTQIMVQARKILPKHDPSTEGGDEGAMASAPSALAAEQPTPPPAPNRSSPAPLRAWAWPAAE